MKQILDSRNYFNLTKVNTVVIFVENYSIHQHSGIECVKKIVVGTVLYLVNTVPCMYVTAISPMDCK